MVNNYDIFHIYLFIVCGGWCECVGTGENVFSFSSEIR